jgi:hypothetical protein
MACAQVPATSISLAAPTGCCSTAGWYIVETYTNMGGSTCVLVSGPNCIYLAFDPGWTRSVPTNCSLMIGIPRIVSGPWPTASCS